MRIPPAMTEDEAKDYQRWLWFQLDKGVDFRKIYSTRWTHDDNMAAQHLGFMVVIPAPRQITSFSEQPQGIPQLVSLDRERTPRELYKKVLDMAEYGDALCKKAVAYLVQLKFKNPTHRFSHEIEDHEWYSKR